MFVIDGLRSLFLRSVLSSAVAKRSSYNLKPISSGARACCGSKGFLQQHSLNAMTMSHTIVPLGRKESSGDRLALVTLHTAQGAR